MDANKSLEAADEYYKRERFSPAESRRSHRNTKKVRTALVKLINDPKLTKHVKMELLMLKHGRYFDIFLGHFAKDLIYAEDLEEEGSRFEAFKVRQILAQKILKMYEVLKLDPPQRKVLDSENSVQKFINELREKRAADKNNDTRDYDESVQDLSKD